MEKHQTWKYQGSPALRVSLKEQRFQEEKRSWVLPLILLINLFTDWPAYCIYFFTLCSPATFLILYHSVLQGKIPSWIWRVWLDQAWVVSAAMKQRWRWSGAFWRPTQTWAKMWTSKRCTGPYRICITVWHVADWRTPGPSFWWW